MMKTKQILILTGVVFSFFYTALVSAEESIKYPVTLQQIEVKDMGEWIKAYGQVGFDTASIQNINLPYSGQVVRLPVMAGEKVKQGQLLAEISADPTVAAAYQKALAGVTFSKSEVSRIQQMLVDHLATQSQLSAAKQQLSDNESQLTQLKKQGYGKSFHVVKALYDSVVSSVNVQMGQRIAAGTTLMQLGLPSQLKVTLGIEPEDLSHIQVGNKVVLRGNTGVTLHTKVNRVLHAVNPQTRLVDVLLQLRGEQASSLIPGMIVSAEVHGQQYANAYVVPKEAIIQLDGGPMVMHAENGVAKGIPVQIQMEQDNLTVITGELNRDMMVVVQGAAELHSGDELQVVAQP